MESNNIYILMMGWCYKDYIWPVAAGTKEAIEQLIKDEYPAHKIHESEPHLYKSCEIPCNNDTYLKIVPVKLV